MQRPRTRSRSGEVVGAHADDDALHLVRVRAPAGREPVVVSRVRIPLPEGVVRGGLIRSAGTLPPSVGLAARHFVADAPVHVALSSLDCAAVPLAGRVDDPLGVLGALAAPHGPAVDSVWADVVSAGDHAVALVGARRSSVVRTASALRDADLDVQAVHAAPVCAVLAATALGVRPDATWTLRLDLPGRQVRATVSRGGRIEASSWASPVGSGPPCFHVRQGPADGDTIDLLGPLGRLLGSRGAGGAPPAGSGPYAPALGAALGALGRPGASPDLARGTLVRPLLAPDELPRWAIEPLGEAADRASPVRARRHGRLAARSRP